MGDAAFADAFRREYRGSAEPEDAAWWLSHPNDAAPSGALPLSAERDRVAKLTYSREGAADPALRAELDRLSGLLRVDEDAARDALRAASRAVGVASAPSGSSGAREHGPDRRTESPDTAVPPGSRPRRLTLAATAVSCLLVGAVSGSVLGPRTAPPAPSSSAPPSASPSPAPTGPLGAGVGGAGVGESTLTEILDREQAPGDLPDVALGRRLDPSSFRWLRMWDVGTPEEAGRPKLFVGRDVTLQMCLGAVVNEVFVAQCLPDSTGADEKSTLNWSVAGSTGTVLWSRTQVTSMEITTAPPSD